MAEADVSSKWLIGQSPEAWVQWVLTDSSVIVEEFLSTEFQHVSRLSDSLLRVRDQLGPFLVLTELQLRPDEHMPQRMRAYTALAEEKYRLSVYPIVFYLLPTGKGQVLPDHYHGEFRGLMAHQDFKVIKAWELEAVDILQQRNLALLPFVPLMHGADETVIRTSAQILREQPEGEKLETVLALFASFVMNTETIQQIVRWNMTILRESPWYQEILEEGIKQGLAQGDLKGQRKTILNFLRARFEFSTETEMALAEKLEQVETDEILQSLVIAAAQAESLAAFNQVLDEHLHSLTE